MLPPLIRRFAGSTSTLHQVDGELLRIVLRPGVSMDFPSTYYRHLIGVFDGLAIFAQVARFTRLAIETSDPVEASDLWPRLFKAEVELGNYEEAYVVIITM